MKFLVGIAVGAIGVWAYQNGKLQGLMGGSPESMQQMWQPAVDRVNQVAQSDTVRQAVSTVKDTVQDKVQQTRGSDIAMPTASEVSGRPSDPLPTPGA